MPGRLVSGLIQAGSMNPVMVLDEIDKLGSRLSRRPLRPPCLRRWTRSRTAAFRDNYLEVPVRPLRRVLHHHRQHDGYHTPRRCWTAWRSSSFTSYTDEEKLQIAKRHLLPKQRKKHGLTGVTLKLSDEAIREIISLLYPRERRAHPGARAGRRLPQVRGGHSQGGVQVPHRPCRKARTPARPAEV